MLTYHPSGAQGDGEPPSGTVWIDLLNATEDQARKVEAILGFPLPARAALAEIEQSSRQVFDHSALRLSVPVVANADSDHPDLSHVGLILTPKLLVSVRFDELKIFRTIAEHHCSGAQPTSAALVFTALMEAFAARHADLLEAARAKLDTVSHTVFRNTSPNPDRALRATGVMRRKLTMLGRIGERVSLIRESMLAVDRAIPFVLEQAKDWFDADQTKRLTAVRADLDSLAFFEEHLSGKIQFLLDAVLGFISIEQNDIFKVLTIASVVGIFPTLVAGWYGMNFHNMPEYGWTYGYQFGIGVIVLSAIVPLLWFKWRGWM